MEPNLRILHLEDDPVDSEMLHELLAAEGLAPRIDRVTTFSAFHDALEREAYSLIMSDYSIPGVDALESFRLARRMQPEVPFIFLSGTIGEDVAIETLKQGATDYVLKQRVERLVPAVRRALHEAEQQARRKQAEEALRRSEAILKQAGQMAHLGAWEIEIADQSNLNANPLRWSDETYRIFGYQPGAVAVSNTLFFGHVPPADRQRINEAVAHALAERQSYDLEHRIIRTDGQERTVLEHAEITYDPQGRAVHISGAVQDITERKRTEDALREADRRKDEFLAMLSHELRNPLAPVRNAVQVLRLVGSREPAAVRQQEILERQVRHMARLLDDLLDVSRITRGRIELKKQPFSLAAVLDHAIEMAAPLIEAKHQSFSVTLPSASEIRVLADPDRLAQVFGNLLTNAAKYTPDGGRIWLEAGLEGAMAVVRVRDTGVGIAPEILPYIFDLFAQADQGLARSQGGLGIGLTMVQKLVAMHGGAVEAFSEGVGRGSQFTVLLPVLRDPQQSSS